MKLNSFICLLCACVIASVHGDPCDTVAEKEIKVFCNNVGLFPHHVTTLYPKSLAEKKKHIIQDEEERARLLVKAIVEFDKDPDVVMLQEIWSLKARDVLIEAFKEKYPYHVKPSPEEVTSMAGQPSGLMMFSKYELRDFEYKIFSKGIGPDKVALKGIIGARLEKDGRSVAVFTTHLQAGGKKDPSIKPSQLKECNELVREFVGDRKDEVIILGGDFNIASSEEKSYGKIFEYLPGIRESYKPGCSPITKTGRQTKDPNKRIDYIFTFDGVEAVSTIIDLAGHTISDHIGVYGVVSLE